MAEALELKITANGTHIQGEPTQHGGGRDKNNVEVLYFEFSGSSARERGSGMATGRRAYNPMVVRKRIDKSTPLFAKAFVQNEKIDGELYFRRPNPNGDGTTEQFYTIKFYDGRIASVRHISPDALDPAATASPPLEEITFTFNTIEWIYEPSGVMHTDSWTDAAHHA